jgi:hypothetical protein
MDWDESDEESNFVDASDSVAQLFGLPATAEHETGTMASAPIVAQQPAQIMPEQIASMTACVEALEREYVQLSTQKDDANAQLHETRRLLSITAASVSAPRTLTTSHFTSRTAYHNHRQSQSPQDHASVRLAAVRAAKHQLPQLRAQLDRILFMISTINRWASERETICEVKLDRALKLLREVEVETAREQLHHDRDDIKSDTGSTGARSSPASSAPTTVTPAGTRSTAAAGQYRARTSNAKSKNSLVSLLASVTLLTSLLLLWPLIAERGWTFLRQVVARRLWRNGRTLSASITALLAPYWHNYVRLIAQMRNRALEM